MPDSGYSPEMDKLAVDAWHSFNSLNSGFFTLSHFERGSVVKVDLAGEQSDGVILSVDSGLSGILTEPRHNVIQLKHTNCPNLENLHGREIGLGASGLLPTPIGEVGISLRAIRKGFEAVYYLPEQVGGKYDCPREDQYHHLMANYGRISINGTVLFDQKDNSFLF